jgi:hypothetical protein
MTTHPDDGARTMLRRSGLAFAVLFLIGWLALTWTWEADATDQGILDWYGESGNRFRQLGGAYLTALAAVAFVVFSTYLARLIPRAAVGQVVRSLGVLFAGTLAIAVGAIATVAGSVEFGEADAPAQADNAEILVLIEGIGFGTALLVGGMAVGAAIIAASYGLRETGTLPPWLIVAGYVVGATLVVAGTLYLPMALLVLWAGAVAITARDTAPRTIDVTARPEGRPVAEEAEGAEQTEQSASH